MRLIAKLRYRPEIDGLRAIAVLAVVLFHAGFGCHGGYVGVDVFFVISGFLITSLIWQDLENGRFTFISFWERRARRIVPALVVVTIATLVAGWFLLLPADFKSLGRASATQAVFGANIHYWLDSGYFTGEANEKPLLHTWSLAVEEQFYLVAPCFLWGMFRTAKLRGRKAVLTLLTVACVLSFALSVYGVTRHQEATFYLLPTRAWELLVGAIVAFLPPNSPVLAHRNWRELVALTGLVLILISVFRYTPDTLFPGLAALPPCLGAALLIWANERIADSMPTTAGALLAMQPLVFIGLISYSLYLWHWPLLAFSKYSAFIEVSSRQRATMLGLGLLCATLSWKYVETPFRQRQLGASRKPMFALAGAGLAVVFGCGLLCTIKQGFPQRFPPQAMAFATATSDMSFTNDLKSDDIRAEKLVPVGVTNPSLRPTILFWGDSHAMAALTAADAFLKEKGLAGRAATHSVTAPVLEWGPRDAINYNALVFSYIKRHQIPNVVLIAQWNRYNEIGEVNPGAFSAALVATVRRLVAAGSHTWVMLDVPTQSFNVPRVLSRSFYSPVYIESVCAKPSDGNELGSNDRQIIVAIEAAGGRILDPKPSFLDPTGQHYIIQANGVALYRDNNHLTTKGAKLMLLPFLRDSLILSKQ